MKLKIEQIEFAQAAFARDLDAVLADTRALLIAKNKAYGDSALAPVSIFGRSSPSDGIRLRIDDKLKRLMLGQADDEDVVRDLRGYLMLLAIAELREAAAQTEATPAKSTRSKASR